jgi:hypothetical protein
MRSMGAPRARREQTQPAALHPHGIEHMRPHRCAGERVHQSRGLEAGPSELHRQRELVCKKNACSPLASVASLA